MMLICIPGGIYLRKVNNRNTRTRCETCSRVTIKIPEWRHWRWRRSGSFIVNFEHISHFVLVFFLFLLTLNMLLPAGIKEHLSKTWSSIHEKVKQHWGWVEKKRSLLKKSVYLVLREARSNVCMQFNLSKLLRICALIFRNLSCPQNFLATSLSA